MKKSRYIVQFWANGATGSTERFTSMNAACAAVIDFVDNDMNQHNRMRRAGFKRIGNVRRDLSLSWEHPVFGRDCGAYIFME